MQDAVNPESGGPSRRAILFGGAAMVVAGAGGYYGWLIRRPFEGQLVTPVQAHALAGEGEIFLVDIRRPDEWAETGVGEGAIPIDMRRADFVEALIAATAEDPDRPVALICARGVRSSQLTARLAAGGMTNLVDVPEGMLGSRAGPGWLKRGLPVTGYSG